MTNIHLNSLSLFINLICQTSLAYKNHSDPVFADPVFGGFSFILHLKHDGIDEGIHDLRKIFKKGDKDEDPFEKYSWMKTFFYNILRNNAPAKPKGMDLSKVRPHTHSTVQYSTQYTRNKRSCRTRAHTLTLLKRIGFETNYRGGRGQDCELSGLQFEPE